VDANKALPKRSLDEAAKDWARISLALRMFELPAIAVTEKRTRYTIVSQ
jgi:hypothetical protein